MAMEMQQKWKSSACGWDSEATHALINIWGQTDVQSKLDSVKRNRDIFLKVSRDLPRPWIQLDNWTWEQCRTKIKNLTQKYRRVCVCGVCVPCVCVWEGGVCMPCLYLCVCCVGVCTCVMCVCYVCVCVGGGVHAVCVCCTCMCVCVGGTPCLCLCL